MAGCKVEGCDKPHSSHGYCKNHCEKWKRGTLLPRLIPSLPGEEWKEIPGHSGLWISSCGRVKNTRKTHERLMKSRLVDGRMLVGDHFLGNVTVHLAVLRAFRPEGETDGCKSVFLDGDVTNVCLDNLRWDTRTDRTRRAVKIAQESENKWAEDFEKFWMGDRRALDRFWEEMRRLLVVIVPRKIEGWKMGYAPDIDDVICTALSNMFISVHNASFSHLDNTNAYLYSIVDTILATHWKYSSLLTPMETYNDEFGTSSILDAIGWSEPSAEMVVEFRGYLSA